MPTMTADQVLDRHYLELRCGLLDLAAALDRISRSGGSETVAEDGRLKKIRQGIQMLLDEKSGRAEKIQLLFSDEYQPGWNR